MFYRNNMTDAEVEDERSRLGEDARDWFPDAYDVDGEHYEDDETADDETADDMDL